MSIEKHFDVPFIASLALQEKQVQQNYRPYIAVHKWFARRPGTLFRGLILSEYQDAPLQESFYRANNLKGLKIADPFMGGGTPLLEANRLGCDVLGFDINPMSYWIVQREIEYLDIDAYDRAAKSLMENIESEVGALYRTACLECGYEAAHAKYFLWVKTISCEKCKATVDLFPGYLIAKDTRHTANVILCRSCLNLNEVADRSAPGKCRVCGERLDESSSARRNSVDCPECGATNRYPRPESGPPTHRLFAMEYHCPRCRARHKGRYFKVPDARDLQNYRDAETRLARIRPKWIPDDSIPPGDETDRLHRWGYRRYREMFNARQLLGLELSARQIAEVSDERIRKALGTNLSDLLRYQNMLCRYDAMALKSLDVFSVHGFPVGLIECESNILGIPVGDGRNVGSGGWSNIVEKYRRAKLYCEYPFEVRNQGARKIEIPIQGERISDVTTPMNGGARRVVQLRCASCTGVEMEANTLDGVFTDPPYFGNVQYAELMDFCYVWLRKMFGEGESGFARESTRNEQEFTVNKSMGRGIEHYTEGMASVFVSMARALKPGSPFAFTYHHNQLDAYFPLAIAMLDSGLVCSAVFPCPAEMGGSIHINGTGSSIVDSVFVCRSTGTTRRDWVVDDASGLARIVRSDLQQLELAGIKPTQGDIRCVVFGHIARLAVWHLRSGWAKGRPTSEKLTALRQRAARLGGPDSVLDKLGDEFSSANARQAWAVLESPAPYGKEPEYVSF